VFIFDITFLTLIINEIKTNLMYVAAALLLVAFTPKSSETTLIQGRIEDGTILKRDLRGEQIGEAVKEALGL
jgi:hypothetical protein